MIITKESIIIDNEKNNKILSLIEEVELLQEQFQEQGEDFSSLEQENKQLKELLEIYKQEFGEYIKGKGFYFNKEK